MTSGSASGGDMPTRPCPYCGALCEADWVDNGVGLEQCGPYGCAACHAGQLEAVAMMRDRLTADEQRTGWSAPPQARHG